MRSLLSIFSFKNRNPLAAIFVFVGTVLVLESIFAFLPQNKLVGSLRSREVAEVQTASLEIMGDSVANGGILAEKLASLLPDGVTVANNAIPGTGPEFPYFLLKRQLVRGKAPKAIIYAPSPHTFATLRIPLLVSGYCTWPETGEVFATGLHTCETAYGALCKLSWTLRYRDELAAVVKGDPAKEAEAKLARILAKTPSKRYFPIEGAGPMYRKPFTCDAFNRCFVEKFLRLAREHDIKVYWVTMPTLGVVADSRKPFRFQADYYGFLDGIANRFGTRFLQKQFLVYGDDDFKDYSHLSEAGAQRFTGFLAGKLGSVLQAEGLVPAGTRSTAKLSQAPACIVPRVVDNQSN